MESFSARRRAPAAVEIEEVTVVGQGGDEAVEKKVFVAVEKELKQGKYKLQWAIQNFSAEVVIVLVHVHRPPQWIPISMLALLRLCFCLLVLTVQIAVLIDGFGGFSG